MNEDHFITAYRESRNGTEHFYFNQLMPKFFYSDGVKECAEAGCYWLIDILASELPAKFIERQEYLCILTVSIDCDNQAIITGNFEDDDPNPYIKHLTFADMPEGDWTFYVSYEGPEFGYRMILPSEY